MPNMSQREPSQNPPMLLYQAMVVKADYLRLTQVCLQRSGLWQSRHTIGFSSLSNTELRFSNTTYKQPANCYWMGETISKITTLLNIEFSFFTIIYL